MKYRELIQFEPLETVIQLRNADQYAQAEQLVSTYVISDVMAEKLIQRVFPLLQIDRPADNKGLLIVGNYGTGKSHLMSVISAVAEHGELAGRLRSPEVAAAAHSIAGRFKVIRTELGATRMALREFICGELETKLAAMGVDYRFPAWEAIPNHKAAFEEMMAAFHQHYPDQGLLLVVDELLDYLGSRSEQELLLDLNFLREIGEVCNSLKFRFMAGLQEMLFDNPRFSFVAGTLLKVKDRFEQVIIDKRDIKFVVAERLLKKTADSQEKIRQHLLRFTRFYGNMNERLEEFVRLFPVHPDYIEMFERVRYGEARAILKVLSRAMTQMLDREVPEDEPGIISYDHYWTVLKEDPSFRTYPEVREVIDCSTKLEELVKTGYPRGRNKELARRIIHGLSLHRLTVGDIEKPVGLTAENLRDTLCLFDPMVVDMGGDPADDLRGEVETALRLIVQTVNGQFISATEQDARGRLGGQFFLDIRKTVDYDALINKRAEALDNKFLDQAYFQALARILDRTDDYYPGTHLAWEYELVWEERQAPRLGYLFFGTPNERSTAQPPREYYLFFLQPFAPPPFKDEKKPGDVFFRLEEQDEIFVSWLRRYAGATAQASVSSAKDRAVYEKKAEEALRELVKWLEEHIMTAFTVTCRGRRKKLQEWLSGRVLRGGMERDVKEIINQVASICLSPYFAELAPEYPSFSVRISWKNINQAVMDALQSIRGKRTRNGMAVLEALELLDGDRLQPRRSRYARYILERLQNKGPQEVLRRDELIQVVNGLEYMAPDLYRLEPELVVVLLAALVYSGDIVLQVAGNRKIDAGSFDALFSIELKDLIEFKHVERPREWDLLALEALFSFFDLAPGLARQVAAGENEPVQELQVRVEEMLKRILQARNRLQNGLRFWGQNLLAGQEEEYRNRLGALQEFVESLRVYSTAGRLKNLRYSAEIIEERRADLEILRRVEDLADFAGELEPEASYLAQAVRVLPESHRWVEEVTRTRQQVLDRIGGEKGRVLPALRQEVRAQLLRLKEKYISLYRELHSRARLGASEDKKKRELMQDGRLQALQRLASIEFRSTHDLESYQNRLAELKSCFQLTEQDLREQPVCPHCNFQPVVERGEIPAASRLEAMDGELDQLVEDWTAFLLECLSDPTVEQNLELLKPEARAAIADFLKQRRLPPDPGEDFIQAVREALAGLTKVVVSTAELKKALLAGGSPATPEEIKRRFDEFLNRLLAGKDPAAVRILVE